MGTPSHSRPHYRDTLSRSETPLSTLFVVESNSGLWSYFASRKYSLILLDLPIRAVLPSGSDQPQNAGQKHGRDTLHTRTAIHSHRTALCGESA